MIARDYNVIKWEDFFYLDETSLSGLRWKISRCSGRGLKRLMCKAGDMAGSMKYNRHYKDKPERWSVGLNNAKYAVHRIIWKLLHKVIDDNMVIDHIDGDPFNNKLTNLVLKSQHANTQNAKMYKTNKTGTTGVHFRNDTSERWIARWKSSNNKFCSKTFSVEKYGHDQAKALAVAYRAEQISLLNTAGASYTERHCGLTPGTSSATSSVQPT